MKFELIELVAPPPSPALRTAGYVGALLAVATATIIGLLIGQRWGTGPVVLLFIPPVLATAVFAGLRPALAASIASTLAYNYYFTVPFRTFVIHSPADVVTVVVLFLVAVVASQLVSLLRQQARLAAAYAARNATIAGFARRLLSCTDDRAIAQATVHELAQLLRCHVALVTGLDTPQLVACEPVGATLAPNDFAAAAMALSTGKQAGRGVHKLALADWQFHPIASDHAVLAAVGVARDDGVSPIAADQRALLDNLLDQAALAFERARLESEAREIATLRERDGLRSALLASIGEEVKPRLTAIAAAARALKRAGIGNRELITSVSAETSKLDRYIDSLVDLAPGSEQEPYRIGDLTMDLCRRTVHRDGQEVHLTPKEYALLVELARQAGRVLTHVHLLRAIWGPAQTDQIDYLRVAIRSLRQKLEADPARPVLILNEPAVGYRLALPLPADHAGFS